MKHTKQILALLLAELGLARVSKGRLQGRERSALTGKGTRTGKVGLLGLLEGLGLVSLVPLLVHGSMPLLLGLFEESLDLLVGKDELALAEEADEFLVQSEQFVAEEADVQDLEFLEDLGFEDIVDRL